MPRTYRPLLQKTATQSDVPQDGQRTPTQADYGCINPQWLISDIKSEEETGQPPLFDYPLNTTGGEINFAQGHNPITTTHPFGGSSSSVNPEYMIPNEANIPGDDFTMYGSTAAYINSKNTNAATQSAASTIDQPTNAWGTSTPCTALGTHESHILPGVFREPGALYFKQESENWNTICLRAKDHMSPNTIVHVTVTDWESPTSLCTIKLFIPSPSGLARVSYCEDGSLITQYKPDIRCEDKNHIIQELNKATNNALSRIDNEAHEYGQALRISSITPIEETDAGDSVIWEIKAQQNDASEPPPPTVVKYMREVDGQITWLSPNPSDVPWNDLIRSFVR
ncbi:uncharacterized protein I206_100940 [Kwoniella pini CBS 10737]|uniref:Uncharacterized protein n=1 Tax=Kwoniella pini CBS 10737 TaxID=1296096 RepID=A0A1B9IBR0_9TREE|nr:uncharacterized protein I206_00386 [Kwoniella pini CBS 10737]OCF53085.1 hypothetical protein I206_00386 [Kwoniella pini CBS 10737]